MIKSYFNIGIQNTCASPICGRYMHSVGSVTYILARGLHEIKKKSKHISMRPGFNCNFNF